MSRVDKTHPHSLVGGLRNGDEVIVLIVAVLGSVWGDLSWHIFITGIDSCHYFEVAMLSLCLLECIYELTDLHGRSQ